MASISLDQLLPSYFSPDDASPIGTWPMPISLTAMCVGFKPVSNGEFIFEGETPIQLRLCERTWRYKHPAQSEKMCSARRWRLEIIADPKKTHLCPEHAIVVAQEPYGTNWVQPAKLKMYSKKSESERPEFVVTDLGETEDPVDWLERNLPYDPWEKGNHYVAGIGFPNGFQEKSRNIVSNFVFGACPDFEKVVEAILRSRAVQQMLVRTQENNINFWYSKADIANPPRLYSVVIEEAKTLMGRSIQQALAGPSNLPSHRPAEQWTGRPVAELVQRIYCDHLNNENRRVQRDLEHTIPMKDK
jgi:hypothetical protein